jgi:hypothetical protein
MAHPHGKEAKDGHNAKLKKMTSDYGLASGPANNINAPPERFKGEGPEDSIGFGANSEGPPPGRSDRASRKQLVANPVATLKHGGRPKHRARGGRADGGPAGAVLSQDRGLAPIASKRARGGRKGHGKTQVNVLVAPQHGAGAPGGAPVVPVPPVAGGMPPAAVPARPPGPPMGAGPMVPPVPVPGPMAPGAPGGIPPGVLPPRKAGGSVGRKAGGSVEGGMGGDEMMAYSRKEQGLKAPVVAGSEGRHMPRGGRQDAISGSGDGNGVGKHHLTAGAVSGLGRLERMGKKPKPNTEKQVV